MLSLGIPARQDEKTVHAVAELRESGTIKDRHDSLELRGTLGPESDTIELREILLKLWRRRWAIIALTLLFMSASGTVAFLMTPQYAGEVYLAINPGGGEGTEKALPESEPASIPEILQTEQYVLRSREIAEATINRLALDHDPELDPERSGGLLQRGFRVIESAFEQWVASIWIASPKAAPYREGKGAATDGARSTRTIENYLKRLKVVPVERSRVILVGYISSNPETAARVTNAVADLYIRRQVQVKIDAREQVRKTLGARLETLEARVLSSERAVEEYRRKTGLVGNDGSSLATQKMTEVNTQLVLAQTTGADAAARVSRLRALSKAPEAADATTEVLSSPLIQQLREEEAAAESNAASLSLIYGAQHPRLAEARQQLLDAKTALQSEVAKVFEAARNELAVAKTREQSLRESLGELSKEVTQANEANVELRALEREAAANRDVYERLLAIGKEMDGDEMTLVPYAAILSHSAVPTVPVSPNRKMIVLIGLVGGLVAGSGYAFVAEQLVGGLRTKNQVERTLGVRCLAQIPALRGRRSRQSPRDYMLRWPTCAFGEAMRAVYISLLMSERRHRIVLVASALPEEGKTAAAACLVSSMAFNGHRVLLVDCDLRKPTAHRHLGMPLGPGLAEVLIGEVTAAEVILRDEVSGADFLPAGLRCDTLRGAVGSTNMQIALRELAAHYDFVVLDSAAVLAAAETLILAQLADETLFLVQWGSTSPEVARGALEQLACSGNPVAGILLSRVNVKRLEKYGDSSAGVQRKLAKYYRKQRGRRAASVPFVFFDNYQNGIARPFSLVAGALRQVASLPCWCGAAPAAGIVSAVADFDAHGTATK